VRTEGAGFAKTAWVPVTALHFGRLAGEGPRFVVEARVANLNATRRDGHQRAALCGEVALEDAIGNDEVAATHRDNGATLMAPNQLLCQKHSA
jgi:hypothetical protein